MADDPNATYFSTSQGTIAGFDAATLNTPGMDIVTAGWSTRQLQAFLLNESDFNFPPEDWVRTVDGLINDHLNNFNNPHNVTLAQIAGDLVEDVMAGITSGTPPMTAPIFAYDASCPLPLNDIFPAQYSITNYLRMTEGGLFVDVSTESEIIGADCITGRAGLPLFSSVNNVLAPDWFSRSAFLVNTQALDVQHATIAYPFHFYQIVETGASGSFGVDVVAVETLSTVYTATFFIIPSILAGSLLLYHPLDPTNIMTVSLADGTYSFTSNAVTGETFVYPSGAMRISFTFTAAAEISDNTISIRHQNTGDTTTVREGIAGRALFIISHPVVSTAGVNQPVPSVLGTPTTAGPLTLNLANAQVPAYLPNALLSLTLDLYPMPANATLTDTNILSMGNLSITRDQVNIYVELAGITIHTTAILPGLNIITLSYSPTQIIFKDLTNPRTILTSTFPPLATSNAVIGPCSGYLHNFVLYATADINQAVEFLTNG